MSRANDRTQYRNDRQSSRSTPYDRRQRGDPRMSADGDRWQHDLHDRREMSRLSDTPTQKLLVEGLHYEVSQDELYELFERVGPLKKCTIKYDRSGRSTGSATIIYDNVEDATRARQEYDGANAKGEPIAILFAPMREMTSIRGAAGGGNLLKRLDRSNNAGSIDAGSLRARMGAARNRDLAPPTDAPTGPAADRRQNGQSIARRFDARPTKSDRRANQHAGKQRGERRPTRATADSLDAELEAFMRAPPGGTISDSAHAAAPAPTNETDTDMG